MNTFRTDFLFIFNLLKLAAEDIPTYHRPWVKEHPLLQRYKLLSEIDKKIPIADYREAIETSDLLNIMSQAHKLAEAIEAFIEKIRSILVSVAATLYNSQSMTDPTYRSVKLAFADLISAVKYVIWNNFSGDGAAVCASKICNLNISPRDVFVMPKEITSKTILSTSPSGEKVEKSIQFQKGIHLFTLLKNLVNHFNRIFYSNQERRLLLESTIESIKEKAREEGYDSGMIDLNSFFQLANIASIPEWDHVNKVYSQATSVLKNTTQNEIVFSKQPSDLLSMSIRSDWTSCQNLLSEDLDTEFYRIKAIHSAISPYAGIIYLTNKQDWQGRGERMLARSLVLYLGNKSGGKPIIGISKLYISYAGDAVRNNILNKFKESLQKHTDLEVVVLDDNNSFNYFIPFHESTKGWFEEHDPVHPYLDYPEIESRFVEKDQDPFAIQTKVKSTKEQTDIDQNPPKIKRLDDEDDEDDEEDG